MPHASRLGSNGAVSAAAAAAAAPSAATSGPVAARREARTQRHAARQGRLYVGLAVVAAFTFGGGLTRLLARWGGVAPGGAAPGGGGGGGGGLAQLLPPPLSWVVDALQRRLAAPPAAPPAAEAPPTLTPFIASLMPPGGVGGPADVLACDSAAWAGASGAPAAAADADALSVVLVATLADLDHAALLLASLRAFLDTSPGAGVRELVVLCPRADRLVFDTMLGAFGGGGEAAPLRIITDDALLLFSDGGAGGGAGGGAARGGGGGAAPATPARAYAAQMLLKLLVARYVASDFYLVLDADALLAGPLRARGALVRDGRALFEPQWRSAHAGWWARAEALLECGAPRAADEGGAATAEGATVMASATPAVLSRAIAARAVCRLRRLHGDARWLRVLFSEGVAAGDKGEAWWTEFALYDVMGRCSGDGTGGGSLYDELHFAPAAGAGSRLLGALTGAAGASIVAWRDEFDAWRERAGDAFGGEGSPGRAHLFVLLQSRAGVAVSRLAEAVAPFLARPAAAVA